MITPKITFYLRADGASDCPPFKDVSFLRQISSWRGRSSPFRVQMEPGSRSQIVYYSRIEHTVSAEFPARLSAKTFPLFSGRRNNGKFPAKTGTREKQGVWTWTARVDGLGMQVKVKSPRLHV